MNKSRRNFLKYAALSGVVAAVGEAGASEKKPISDDSYGMIYDTTRCIGCRTCEQSCNEQNKLPEPKIPFDDEGVLEKYRTTGPDNFTVVNRFKNPKPDGDPLNCKIQCMHCNEPGCASACIVNALNKTPEGSVFWDSKKCIGCRYCMIACPFQVPKYEFNDALTPRVRKCTFCYTDERLKSGNMPACAENCPAEAITFGKRKDLIIQARERIAESPDEYLDHIYGEHEVGGTAKMYLAPKAVKDLTYFKFPGNLKDEPVPQMTETIQHSVFKYFIPPVAAYAVLGGIMYAKKPKHGSENDEEGEVE
ncbi:MAG: 4Fe-4S dicluster domain-containing protein [bacterium]